MLKFNVKEHKLEELENYGFKRTKTKCFISIEYSVKLYDLYSLYIVINKNESDLKKEGIVGIIPNCISSLTLGIIDKKSICDVFGNISYSYDIAQIIEFLYNLIKDGLIIKEDE